MLSIGFYGDPDRRTILLDATPYVTRLEPSWGARGCADCRIIGAFRYRDQLRLIDAGLLHVGVYDAGQLIWAGRTEKPAIDSQDGVEYTAFGYSRCFDDIPYTALWSHSGTADWRPVRTTETSTRAPDRYTFDVDNRLYIAPNKGAVHFGAAGTARLGAIGYRAPNGGSRVLTTLALNYDVVALSGDWQFGWNAYSAAPGNAAWTAVGGGTIVTGSGTGSTTIALPANTVAVQLWFYQATGAAVAQVAETGTYYAIATNVRVTSQATPIDLGNIAADMVTMINGNGGLSTRTDGCALTGLDLRDEVYEDENMASILDRLCVRGDSAGEVWDWQVDNDRIVQLRPAASGRQQWAIDAANLALSYDYDNVANRRYAVYQESDNFRLRTAVANDNAAQVRAGVVRSAPISAQTTSAATAAIIRDTALADTADPDASTHVDVTSLYTVGGARAPLWLPRAGDVATIRNITPGTSVALDAARVFRVGRVSVRYQRKRRPVLRLESRTPLPALDVLLAQRG